MEDLELTGTCPLITPAGSDEYLLPTQKHRGQLNKTKAIQRNCNLDSKKLGSKNNFKITDKILSLYNTSFERETSLNRVRSIAKNGHENSCLQSETSLDFRILKHSNSLKFEKTQIFPNRSMYDTLKRSGRKGGELSPLTLMPVTTNDSLYLDGPCVSQVQMKSLKTLDKIRPCHPQFAKEIKVHPEEALKINSLILTERLKMQLTPTSNVTFPMIENTRQYSTDSPKYWWKYLNEKLAKKMSNPLPCFHKANKECKLCELNSEHDEQIEDTLPPVGIELKRLGEVHAKDWSSYGHYTRIHKLKYTKRQNNLLRSKANQVEVDEDYLSVDVDRLMSIYEQKPTADSMGSKVANRNTRIQHDDADISNNSQCMGISESYGMPCFQVGNDNRNHPQDIFRRQDKQASVQRPATTKLRSCVNFTSRKTCYTNAS